MFQRQGWFRHSVGALVLLGAVAGCGGGGGEAPGASGGPQSQTSGAEPAPSSSAVSVRLVSPSRIEAEKSEGGSLLTIVTLQAEGAVESLVGQTLYVVIEDPASLYDGNPPAVQVDPVSKRAFISILGQPLSTAGLREGQLRVNVCIDPQCRRPLEGSPMAVPFRVMVHPGLELDKQEVTATVPFGPAPVAQTVNVKLPRGTTTWKVESSRPPSTPQLVHTTSTTAAGSETGVISLQLLPARPGTHTDTLTVSASVNGLFLSEKRISILYTVAPNPDADVMEVMSPTPLTQKQGTLGQAHVERWFLTSSDALYAQFNGFEYLAGPPEATGKLASTSWWSFPGTDYGGGARSCVHSNGFGGVDCLPVGTYTGRTRLLVTDNRTGMKKHVYTPVTFEVLPP